MNVTGTKFVFEVENSHGDHVEVTVTAKRHPALAPARYKGCAILLAIKFGLPKLTPYKVEFVRSF